MGEASFPEPGIYIVNLSGGANSADKSPRVLSAIVEVLPFAIIHPSPHKKKIDLRSRWKTLIDELKRRIVGQHPCEIGLPALSPFEIFQRRERESSPTNKHCSAPGA